MKESRSMELQNRHISGDTLSEAEMAEYMALVEAESRETWDRMERIGRGEVILCETCGTQIKAYPPAVGKHPGMDCEQGCSRVYISLQEDPRCERWFNWVARSWIGLMLLIGASLLATLVAGAFNLTFGAMALGAAVVVSILCFLLLWFEPV